MVAIPASGGNFYWRKILIQMANPKAALHSIAIVGIALVVSTTILSLLGHLAYAIAFSTTPIVISYKRSRRWIDGALGLFFTVAAIKIATYKAERCLSLKQGC